MLFLLGLVFLCHQPASSQDLSRLDVFAGASFVHLTGPTEPSLKVYGAVFSGTYNVNSFLGWAGEFGYYPNPNGSGRAITYMFGPKVFLTLHKTGRFVPYGQWLLGAMHTDAAFNGTPSGSTNFTMSAGLGLDVNVMRHVAIRPFEGDFLVTTQPNCDTTGGGNGCFTQKSFRYSGGVVFRF